MSKYLGSNEHKMNWNNDMNLLILPLIEDEEGDDSEQKSAFCKVATQLLERLDPTASEPWWDEKVFHVFNSHEMYETEFSRKFISRLHCPFSPQLAHKNAKKETESIMEKR